MSFIYNCGRHDYIDMSIPDKNRKGELMMTSTTPRWILIILGLLGGISETSGAGPAILMKSNATEVERFAAEELQNYLKKITGEQIPIVSESSGDIPLLIVKNADDSLKDSLGEDGYVLRSNSGNLLLSGGSDRGTLYAVYDFLERLGCRWYYYDPEDEVIPRRPLSEVLELMRDKLNVEEKPDYSVRMLQYLVYDLGPAGTYVSETVMAGMPRLVDWLAKNRLNIFQFAIDHTPNTYTLWPSYRKLMPELRKRGMIPAMGGHCLFMFLSVEDFEDHPEWRTMINGQRSRHAGQFCTRNEQAVRRYIDNMIRFLRENPEIEYFAPWPDDGGRWCECSLCKDTPSADRVMELSNRIYTELKQAVPKVRYTHFAYGSHLDAPEKVRPLPGLTVTLCTHSRNLGVPFTDEQTKPEYREAFARWSKLCAENDASFVFHEKYARTWGLGGFHPLPLPIYSADFRWFKEQGLAGFELPMGYMGQRTKCFNLHVLGKVMWHAEAEIEPIVADYFTRFYGPSAAAMRQAYEEVERAQPILQYWSKNPLINLHIVPAGQPYPEKIVEYVPNVVNHLSQAKELIEKARQETSDQTVLARIGRFDQSTSYVLLEYQVLSHLIEAAAIKGRLEKTADTKAYQDELAGMEQHIQAAKKLSDQREDWVRSDFASGLYWDVVAGTPGRLFVASKIDDWLDLLNRLKTAGWQGDRSSASDDGLIGYWRLAGNCADSSIYNHGGSNQWADIFTVGPKGIPNTAAAFDGKRSYIEICHKDTLNLGTSDFTVSAWICTEANVDTIGDILDKFDPATRKGFNFAVLDNQYRFPANRRNLFFGMDNAQEPVWTDCGKCDNVGIWCMSVHKGRLYAGSYIRNNGSRTDENSPGHVYRYEGGTTWTDCGRVADASNVLCLADFQGSLYAGVSYATEGDRLAGKIYRLDESSGQWIDCGYLGKHLRVECMAVCNGKLYAGTYGGLAFNDKYSIYVYEGGKEWVHCNDPWTSLSSLGVYHGYLFAAQADLIRYEGQGKWTDCGRPGADTGQTWSLATYQGDLYAGTFPPGHVHRYEGGKNWVDCGRLTTLPDDNGQREVMALAVYNGKLYGSLWPNGEVYRYDDEQNWTHMKTLGLQGAGGKYSYTKTGPGPHGERYYTSDAPNEHPPVWPRCYAGAPGVSRTPALTVYQGKLFAGTWNWEYDLPGHVYSLEAGRSVSYDHELEPGWKHVAVVRAHDRLILYIDGRQVAVSSPFDPADYDLSNTRNMRIGMGTHDYFKGKISEVRLYKRALSEKEIRALYEK